MASAITELSIALLSHLSTFMFHSDRVYRGWPFLRLAFYCLNFVDSEVLIFLPNEALDLIIQCRFKNISTLAAAVCYDAIILV